jgi:hypothetical protein
MVRLRARALILAAATGLAAPTLAHDLARSESVLRLAGPRELHATLTLNLLDFPSLANLDRNHDQAFSYDEVDRGIDRIYELARAHLTIGGPGPPASVSLDRYDMLDATAIRLDLTYRFSADVTGVRVASSLAQAAQPGHMHVTVFQSDRGTRQAVLTGDAHDVTFVVPGRWTFGRLLATAALVAAGLILLLSLLVRRAVLT